MLPIWHASSPELGTKKPIRPCRWRESIRVSRVRTRTRCRYAVFSRSGDRFGSSFESYVPSASRIWRSPSFVVRSRSLRVPMIADHVFEEELARSVRGSDEGPRRHVGEAHGLARLAEAGEGLRRHVRMDGQVPLARPQVLAQGD